MPARVAALVGSLLFLCIAPGTIAGYVPYLLTRWKFEPPLLGLTWLRAVGAVMLTGGVAVLIDSFLRFALEGRGTPAPVAPTEQLVVSGPYRYVRNPMYVAIVSTVLGQALLFGSEILLAYAILLWLMFHVFVLAYEEPMLRRRYGRSYEAYCANVARWIPRLSPWDPHPWDPRA